MRFVGSCSSIHTYERSRLQLSNYHKIILYFVQYLRLVFTKPDFINLLEALCHGVEALGVRVERVKNALHVESAAHIFKEDAHESAVLARRRAAHEFREDGALTILRALRVRERERVQLAVKLGDRKPLVRRGWARARDREDVALRCHMRLRQSHPR